LAILDCQDRLADLDRVSHRNVDLGDRSGMGTGKIRHGLVGLQFHDGLIGLDRIPFGDVNLGYLGAFDALAQFGHLEFRTHAGCPFLARLLASTVTSARAVNGAAEPETVALDHGRVQLLRIDLQVPDDLG
jgi:hypothetical protein